MDAKQELFPILFSTLSLNYFENYLDDRECTVPMHWHNRLEIIHVLEGKGSISIDLQEYPISAGDIVTVIPGSLHAVWGDREQPLHCQTVSFSLEIPEFLQPFSFVPVIHPDMPGNPVFVHTLDAILQICVNRKEGCEALLTQYLTSLFHLFSYYGYRQAKIAPASNVSHALKEVLQYMDEHYAEKLSISLLADICNYSKYYFCRFFSAAMGCSCKKYLQRLRTEKAKQLLTTTSLSIAEISQLTGFDEVSYFISVFRAQEGCTPLRYRKQKRLS